MYNLSTFSIYRPIIKSKKFHSVSVPHPQSSPTLNFTLTLIHLQLLHTLPKSLTSTYTQPPLLHQKLELSNLQTYAGLSQTILPQTFGTQEDIWHTRRHL